MLFLFFNNFPLTQVSASNLSNINTYYNEDLNLDENTMQIVFFERVVRLLEFPDNKLNNEFIILIVNNDKISSKTKEIFKTQKIKEKKVNVISINLNDGNENEVNKLIKQSNLVYIDNSIKKDKFDELINSCIESKTLSFSYKSNYLTNGLNFNYVLKNNKIKYEVNQSSLQKIGYKPSYILLNYAEKVVKDE